MSKKKKSQKPGIFRYQDSESPAYQSYMPTNYTGLGKDKAHPRVSDSDVEAAREWVNDNKK